MASKRTKDWISRGLALVFGLVFLIGSFYQVSGMFEATPQQLIGQAENQHRAGQNEAALASLQQAKKKVANDARIYLLEGQIYREQKQWQQAQQSLEQARAYATGDPLVYQLLGLTYVQLKKNPEAEAAFKKATNIAPNDGSMYNNLGVFYVQTGNRQAARKAFEKGIQIQPDLADTYLSLGVLNQDEGKPTEASAAFARYLELNPNAPEKSEIASWLMKHPAPKAVPASPVSSQVPAGIASPTPGTDH